MNRTAFADSRTHLMLDADTAADLMTPNPISLRADASVREAVALLIDKGFSAAPVIDHAGHAVGVLSRSDLLVHDREKVDHPRLMPDFYDRGNLRLPGGEWLPDGFSVEVPDPTVVSDLMTPVVFSVTLDTPAARVVSEMLSLRVHRLFVIEPGGPLVGVISALDVLRKLATV